MHPDHCASLIRQIHCATEKEINNDMRAQNLTHAQLCLIFSLIEKEAGCCSFKQVEKRLGLAQSTTLGIVKRSEEKGLVECFPDPEDRRSKSVRVTQKGIDLYRKTQDKIVKKEERLLKALNAEERDTFRSLLTKVRNSFYTV